MGRTPEATSRPPKPPRRLSPRAIQNNDTHAILRRYVPAARANLQSTILQFHFDGVPAPVFLSGAVVANVVLLAQFVGDVLGRGIEIAEAVDDFGAASGIVRDCPERVLVHTLAPAPAPRASAKRRKLDLRRHLWTQRET